ncbi:hypothetical protein KGP36_04855 [Patescibacteria group bacterium]|nr:hypothetical protein [Patescibacteria group bacterium]
MIILVMRIMKNTAAGGIFQLARSILFRSPISSSIDTAYVVPEFASG